MPFSTEEFFKVFERYNLAVYPIQGLFLLLAIVILLLVTRTHRWASVVIACILSFFWIWMGMVYHIGFFSRINPAAYFFGAVFILQAILLVVFGSKMSFRTTSPSHDLVAYTCIGYGLILYPIFGYANGHVYPSSPTFGLPCPTTIFTLGILLLADRTPRVIFLIPFLWSLVGTLAAFYMGVYEDFGLLAMGLVLMRRSRLPAGRRA